MKIGYIKQTMKQSEEYQLKLLEAAGCTKIFQEMPINNITYSRDALEESLQHIQAHDVFTVTGFQICSSNILELDELIRQLEDKETTFVSLEEQLDTSTPTGQLMVKHIAVLAQFEVNLRYQRQADGRAKARKRGVNLGRRRKLTDLKVKKALELKSMGMTNQQIANKFEVNRSTLLKYLAERKVS